MDYADYIDRTDYDSVDAVRAGIDADAGAAALKSFYDKDIDGITEDIIGRRAARLPPAFHEESVGPAVGAAKEEKWSIRHLTARYL